MEIWQKPEYIAAGLGIIILVFIALSVFIVFIIRQYFSRMLKEEQKRSKAELQFQLKLLRNSNEVQERERRRFAADLHDGLISKLNATALLLAKENNETVNHSKELLTESITLARNISHDLIPPMLEHESFLELFNDFIFPFHKTYEISFYHDSEVHPNLSVEKKLQVYRIFQEIMNNIIKHAKASRISINLKTKENSVYWLIEDDGVGFDVNSIKNGLGLSNITARVQLLQAQHKFKSELNKGTRSIFLLQINE